MQTSSTARPHGTEVKRVNIGVSLSGNALISEQHVDRASAHTPSRHAPLLDQAVFKLGEDSDLDYDMKVQDYAG